MKEQNTCSLFFMWRTSSRMTDLLVAQAVGHLHLRELKELSDTLIQVWKKIPRTPSTVTLGAFSNNIIPSATHGGEHIMFETVLQLPSYLRAGVCTRKKVQHIHTSFQLLISQNYNFRNQHIIKYHSFYFVFQQEVCILLFSFMCSFAYSLWTCPQAPYFYCLDFVNVLVISTIKGSL